MSDCEHQFIFLRQDKRNEGYDRNPTWVYEDIYFCERCLEYHAVAIKKTVPSRERFGEDTIWHKRG